MPPHPVLVRLSRMLLRFATLPGPGRQPVVDIRVRDGLIQAIEPAGSLQPDGDEEVIELDRRLVHPGFWDEHVHMGLWAAYRRSVSLADATSASEAANLMAAAPAVDDVLVGVGYRDGLWPDEKSAALLDALSGDTPWVLWSVDVHACWLNSAAMARFDMDTTNSSGVFVELDAFGLAERLRSVPDEIKDSHIDEALAEAHRKGVVGVVDFDFDDNITNWRRRRATGRWSTRIETAVYPDYVDSAIAAGLRSGDDVAAGVTLGFLKVITDGSLNTRTARCCEPYLGIASVEYGQMNYETDVLRGLMEKAKAHGFVPAFHAIGDEANQTVLDLFEEVGIAGRIEHAQLLRSVDLRRFQALGVQASVQPQHAVDDRDVADRYWGDRTDRVIPVRDLLDAGADVLFGSDAPVSALDPFAQIASAVTRSDHGRVPWEGDQTVTVAEAMACSARTTLEVGQPADIIALGANPFWMAEAMGHRPEQLAEALRQVPVDLTVVDGRVAHNAV